MPCVSGQVSHIWQEFGVDLRIVHRDLERVGRSKDRLVPESCSDTIDDRCRAHRHGDRIYSEGCTRARSGRGEIKQDHTQKHTQSAGEY